MTLLNVPNYIYYAGDGGTTSFPFPYKFFDDTEILVYSITATATTLLAAGYSISKTGSAPYDNCNVVMAAAPASGTTLYIERIVDIAQNTDLPTGGTFRESTIENALDRLTMIAQQLDMDIGRGIKIPVALASSTADLDFPPPLADNYIGWNAAGDALENKTLAGLGTVAVTSFTSGFLSGVTDQLGMRVYSGTSTAAEIKATLGTDSHTQQINNLSFSVTASGTSLIVYFKDKDGNDPTAASPVVVSFRSGTSSSSLYDLVSLSSGTSITLPSGTSQFGYAPSENGRIYIYGINNGGVIEPALSRTAYALEDRPHNTLAISSSSGGTTVLYSASARTGVPVRCLGYMEVAISGTTSWSNSPTLIQVMGPGIHRTGDVIQIKTQYLNSAGSTGNTIPIDNTIPQIGEGAEVLNCAITPTSSLNRLYFEGHIISDVNANDVVVLALFEGTTANAIASTFHGITALLPIMPEIAHSKIAPSATSTTYTVRQGAGASASYWNQRAAGAILGTTQTSYLKITEVFS